MSQVPETRPGLPRTLEVLGYTRRTSSPDGELAAGPAGRSGTQAAAWLLEAAGLTTGHFMARGTFPRLSLTPCARARLL